jgi:hypothetical protein
MTDTIEDDIDVVIEDAPAAEVVKVEGATPKPKVIEPEEGLETLKKQLADEKVARAADQQARSDADKRAREAEHKVAAAENNVQDTNLSLVTNAIDTIKQSNDILKGRYRDAMAAGDFDAAADVQLDMSTNAAKLMQLEQGKIALESQPKREPRTVDLVESFAGQLSPRSASWVRSHPQFATDQRLNRKMVRAHEDAIDEGFVADTDAYFDFVERKLELRQSNDAAGDGGDALSDAAASSQRRASPSAAPVSREGSSTNGQRPNTVRLTAAEREMAQMMDMSDTEYAKQKITLQREGKLPN